MVESLNGLPAALRRFHGRAGGLQVRHGPSGWEVAALAGFDGVDAASVIRAEEHAGAIILFDERQIAAARCQSGVSVCKLFGRNAKVRSDGVDLVTANNDIAGPAAAGTALLAGMMKVSDGVGRTGGICGSGLCSAIG
ncbi:MAG: hypothetical protein A3K19_32470 [Lentisphaerae bacterium RIFOXYB12_FULL_65_16]|nr:MAG: hypothetical protein A3K18_19405 [Lentisphaerae bacterium RIFOXYA12_64_32]OGV91434.1 MAG: hypothetical protein A3K19_32470 [Lentisphaerae bacterium RIFOXYB12_FULL_65_16]